MYLKHKVKKFELSKLLELTLIRLEINMVLSTIDLNVSQSNIPHDRVQVNDLPKCGVADL